MTERVFCTPAGPADGWQRAAGRAAWTARVARAGLLAVAIAPAIPVAAQAQAPAASAASAFIEGTATRLVAVVDGDDTDAVKAARLQTTVDATVDVETIAKFCLGRYWLAATPAQRQAFLDLFHRVLLDGVTGQIRGYKGVVITLGRAQPRDDDTVVSSLVARPGKGSAKVDWLIGSTPAGLRIEDVIAEGTSLRLTRRNDYGAFLASHGGNVDALLAAMRQRLGQP